MAFAVDRGGTAPDEVGQILVQVQDDLQQLKNKLLSQASAEQNKDIDITYLENAIRKTEKSLKTRTEEALNHINNHVTTLLDLEDTSRQQHAETANETLWRIHPTPVAGKMMSEVKSHEKNLFLTDGSQVAGLTPGQQLQQMHYGKIIENPHNVRNREVVNNAYKIQLPLINDRKSTKSTGAEIAKGSTVVRLAVLPQPNRLDQQITLPGPDENDAKRGILSMIDRGFIPPGSQLVLEPHPIKHNLAALHNAEDRQKDKVSSTKDGSSNMSIVKYDPLVEQAVPSRPQSAKDSENPASVALLPRRLRAIRNQSQNPKAVVPLRLIEMSQMQPHPPPTTPSSTFIKKQHRFAMQHGRVKDKSEEFILFKQNYGHLWGSVATMLKYLEKMLCQYSVPVAFINGDKLVDISFDFELEQKPTVADLLEVIVNREEVEQLIKKPGSQYKGFAGRELAAAKIQATYRMYRQHQEYAVYRRRKWAAGVLAMTWIMCVKMFKVRSQLKKKQLQQLEAFRRRSQYLASSWQKIKQSKRVIIHIPSLGYSESQRQSISLLDIKQNLQTSRLCDLKDPNVDVIYVSPVPLSDDFNQYYSKLIGLKPAIDSGNSSDQADLSKRYQIIVPDAMKDFPSHNMCLSSILKYSPRTLQRIKNLIHGREAYIVTGMPHVDDIFVADYLDVAILAPEPDLAHLYSTKSGSKRIFDSAVVAVPPGEFDIYSLHQLYEMLTQLIIDNLDISRWLLKIDGEFDSRGIVCLDVLKNLKCFHWVLKEAEKYANNWSNKWAQENSYLKIYHELPQFLSEFSEPVNRTLFPSWDSYLKGFLSQGGVIEACPPTDSVTTLTVNMLIEPDGAISTVSSGDQIHAESEFRVWGFSSPQSSVEPAVLNKACTKIAESCKSRGIMGYFSIDFVTFLDPKSTKQILWATDLDLKYCDQVAMHHLLEFMTCGSFDPQAHLFHIPPPKPEEKKKRRRNVTEIEPPKVTTRYAVMSTRLYHSNMSMVMFSVFLQMCRAHSIGFDIKEKHGTVLTVMDTSRREYLGMLTVGESLQGVLASFASNLSIVHQEVSAPNLQGKSNFKAAILDIEDILGITIENLEAQNKHEMNK